MLLVLCCAGAGTAVGCDGGSSDGDEAVLGTQTTPSKAERTEDRIAALERKLARRKRRQARPTRAESVGGEILASDAAASFDARIASLGASAGVAVGPVGDGDTTVLGDLTSGSAWSTIKVPIAMRAIDDAGGPATLPAATRDLLSRAITASDNAAAASLWTALSDRHGGATAAADAIGATLAAGGDTETVVSTVGRDGFSPYGQTEWTLAAQERFMASLAGGCMSPDAAAELRSLMGQVVADQRWGLGSTDAQAYFKGGWGPGADGRYLARQMGVLEHDGGAVAVAIAAIAGDGQFASATAAVTEIARWVSDNVVWSSAQPRGC